MTLPVGAATWFTRGTYEPDTMCDTEEGCTTPTGIDVAGGYMYPNADTSTDAIQIYFNGFTESRSETGVNPNNEVVGSRMNPTGAMRFRAWLGVWKDCDGDGYIGAANGALIVYSSSLLPTTSPCADGTIHNRGGWVYEFIWIGRGGLRAGDQDYPSADDQRWINDTDAMVWLDFNLPGAAPRGSCPISPLPRGTTSSTGGVIRYADCLASRRMANAVNTVDSDGSLGLAFEDVNNPQRSDSTLNQRFPVHLWRDNFAGESHDRNETGIIEQNSQKEQDNPEAGDDRAFTVWDCSQPEQTTVTSPVNEVEDPSGGQIDDSGTIQLFDDEGHVIEIAAPAPAVNNPRGSYYDALNHTERGAANAVNGGGLVSGAKNCDKQQGSIAAGFFVGGDNQTTMWVVAPPSVEGGVTAAGVTAKRTANDVFSFDLGGQPPRGGCMAFTTRNGCNVVVREDPRNSTSPVVTSANWEDTLKNVTGGDTGDHINDTLGEGYQYGLQFRGALILHPGWSAITAWTNTDVTIDRATLEPQSGVYRTFYARIGATTTGTGAQTPKANAASIYGQEWCKGATSGESTSPAGFDCDPTHWYNPAFDASSMPTANGHDIGPRAGYAYHLRDVDCVDGTLVRGVPVHASLVDLSANGPCQDAP